MPNWQKWVPNQKVTAGAFAGAFAFVVIFLIDEWLVPLTTAEAVGLGSAFAVLVAYLVPERRQGEPPPPSPPDDDPAPGGD